MSPLFFFFAYLPFWTAGRFNLLSIVMLWILFVLMEISDMLDGAVARSTGVVSDIGKLLDPFADVVSRLTSFLVFATFSIMPVWMFVLIMYRELGIIFVRMLMVRDGVTLAARRGGKTKTVVYAVSTALGLLMLTHLRLRNLHGLMPQLPWLTIGAFGVSVIFSWGSFADYLVVLRRHYRTRG